MERIAQPFWLLLLLSAFLNPIAIADEQTDQAVEAAKAWLELVDAEKYEQSWLEAVPFFKEKVEKDEWIKTLTTVRKSLGEAEPKELLGAQYETTLPHAPDGEYVVIQFETSFAHKPNSIETITPMKTESGEWRVSGYYVK